MRAPRERPGEGRFVVLLVGSENVVVARPAVDDDVDAAAAADDDDELLDTGAIMPVGASACTGAPKAGF